MKNRKKKSKRWWLKLIKQQRLANLYFCKQETMAINFMECTEDIKKYMTELHLSFMKGSLPTDKEIAILGKKFFERDKDIAVTWDLEMSQVIRGFEWGMITMRQIIEGKNL